MKQPGKASEAGGEAPDVEVIQIDEGATKFKLKSLDVFLMGYIYDNASTLSGKQGTDEVGIHTRMNQTNIECVRHGLAGFMNFADAKGNQIAFKTQKAVVNGRAVRRRRRRDHEHARRPPRAGAGRRNQKDQRSREGRGKKLRRGVTAIRLMPERQCEGCKRQKDWGCTAEKFPAKQQTPGARPDRNGDWWLWRNPSKLPLTVDGEESYACPRQDIRARPQAWQRMLLFYGFYRKGHLPQSGAIMDQANKAMELFRVFDDVNSEVDKVVHDREIANQARRAQHGR